MRYPTLPKKSVSTILTPPTAALTAVLLIAPPTAHAADGVTVGDHWQDGYDTRYQAYRIGTVATNLGYNMVVDLNGRMSTPTWEDITDAAVFGFFGHANAGFIKTKDDPGHWINGGFAWTDYQYADEDERFISEYYPYSDVDEVRLAIFSGCYTTLAEPKRYGYLVEASVARGVDAVVSFPGLVYSPNTPAGTPMSETNYSGGYFWNRAAYYLGRGNTINAALQKAVSDLIAKEGRGRGYQRYRIHGSVDQPGSVRLKPAGSGEPLTSDPSWEVERVDGTAAYAAVAALTPTATSTSTGGPAGPLTEVRTAQGVDYRLDAGGELFDLSAATATSGAVTYSMDQARQMAHAFAREHADGFDGTWSLVEEQSLSHVGDDSLGRFGWRPDVDGRSGPRQVVVEVDRRTGAVTYYLDAAAQAGGTEFALSREQAVDAARRTAGALTGQLGAEQISAVPDVWDRPRWVVTLDRGLRGPEGGHQTPDVLQIDIDAATGAVLAVSGT